MKTLIVLLVVAIMIFIYIEVMDMFERNAKRQSQKVKQINDEMKKINEQVNRISEVSELDRIMYNRHNRAGVRPRNLPKEPTSEGDTYYD